MSHARLPLPLALLVLTACFGAAGPGSGAGSRTWWVAASNSTGRFDGQQASPFLSISDALDQARDGDRIRVTAGTYAENLVIDRDVVILGDGADVTVLQGNGASRVVTVSPKTRNVRIEGFAIQGGYSSHSSALFADQAQVTLRRCLFTANATGDDGAGSEQWQAATVRLRRGTYQVDQCVFLGNTGSDLTLDDPGFCLVANCVLAFSTRFAIHVRGNQTSLANDAKLLNLTIFGATLAGILMDNGANARITNVLEEQCGIGVQENPLGGDPVLRYCCLPDGYRDQDTNSRITNPVVMNGLTPPGTNGGNLARLPGMVDPAGSDFRLAPGSPCIDRGDPSIRDVDGSRSDLGAFGGPRGDFYDDFSFLAGSPFVPAAWAEMDLALLEEPGTRALRDGAVWADADGDGGSEAWAIEDGRLVRRRPSPDGSPAPVPPWSAPIRAFRLFDLDEDGQLDVLLQTSVEPQVWLQRPGPLRTVPVHARPGDQVEVWTEGVRQPLTRRTAGEEGDRADGAMLLGLGRSRGVSITVLRDGHPHRSWHDVGPTREALNADD